jgi:hypothetical protein
MMTGETGIPSFFLLGKGKRCISIKKKTHTLITHIDKKKEMGEVLCVAVFFLFCALTYK